MSNETRSRSRPEDLLRRYGPAASVALLALVAWQLIVTQFNVADYLIPPPLDVATAMKDNSEVLLDNAWVTGTEVVLGFLGAVVVGAAVAVLLHVSPSTRRAVYPLLVASQTIPIVVIAPILVVILGFDLAPKLAIVGLICFFPVVVSAVDGLESVDPSLRDMMRSLYGTRWNTLTRVEIPAALPSAFSGARIAATYAAIGAVFGEWSGASAGLGYLIQQSAASLDTTTMFAAVVVLCLMAFALVSLVGLLERFVVPWAPRFAKR